MAAEKLKCEDLLGYLQNLPAVRLARIYQHSASCLAVFRELPDLSKQYVLRLLFLDQPLPMTLLNSWPRALPQSQALHREAVSKLGNLRVCEELHVTGGEAVQLNASFKTNLRVLLCGGGQPWAVVGHTGEDKHARDVEYLDTYANKQWEGILQYMVGESNEAITRATVEVLMQAQLMASSGHSQPTITTLGFQFLLLDQPSQVWYFLLQYLASAESRLDIVECLNFIFQLSFLVLGKDYSTDGLTESQLKFIQHLREFGLAYQRKRSSKRYFPTKLAINLVSGHRQEGAALSEGKSGFLLVETNFRVTAYTDSQLQISILDLFCQLQYRFPNLIVGTITRESVLKALKKGLTADQVLTFLRLHAHPQMLTNVPIIPPTVSDQIRLWEMERDRLEISEGVLYSDFHTASDFETVRKYADDLGVLMWSNSQKRFMVVTAGGHNEVKRFWRRQSSKAAT